MTDQAKKYLYDIISAIELIYSFTSEISSYELYCKDLKTQSAVERQLGIIGEAVNKFEKVCPGTNINNSRQIIGFRNRIIHAYDTIDPTMIWAILKRHLEPLRIEVLELMNE